MVTKYFHREIKFIPTEIHFELAENNFKSVKTL